MARYLVKIKSLSRPVAPIGAGKEKVKAIAMEITTDQAAEILSISVRRIQQMITDGQLDARKIGTGRRGIWLIDRVSVQRRLLIQNAQKAWAILGIPPRLWGAWWLSSPDEIQAGPCPSCGATAYSPAGGTKYSNWAACPSCKWIEKE